LRYDCPSGPPGLSAVVSKNMARVAARPRQGLDGNAQRPYVSALRFQGYINDKQGLKVLRTDALKLFYHIIDRYH
jgi:hypothetical protein